MPEDADLLTLRLLDLLLNDEEAIESLFLGCNYDGGTVESLRDIKLTPLAQRFTLGEIIGRLRDLELLGLVNSRRAAGYDESHGIGGMLFRLTDKGRELWRRHMPNEKKLYEHS